MEDLLGSMTSLESSAKDLNPKNSETPFSGTEENHSGRKRKRRRLSPRKIIEKRMEEKKNLQIVRRNKNIKKIFNPKKIQKKIDFRNRRRMIVMAKKKIIDQEQRCKFYVKSKMHDLKKTQRKLKEIETVCIELKLATKGFWLHFIKFLSMLEMLDKFFWKIKMTRLQNFLWDSRFRRMQRTLRDQIYKRKIKFGDFDLAMASSCMRLNLTLFSYNKVKNKSRNIVAKVLKAMFMPMKLLAYNQKIFFICKKKFFKKFFKNFSIF